MKKYRFLLLLICLLLCLQPFSVFAANTDYLNAEKWEDNPRVKTSDLERHAPLGDLYGRFSFVKDHEELAVYTYVAFSESTMAFDDSDDVRVIYEFHMSDDTYVFSLNSNGICEEFGEESNLFEYDINLYNDGSTCYLMSYGDYNGNALLGDVKVYLSVNNSRYLLQDKIHIQVPEKTTKKKTTTTKRTNKKRTKKSRKATSSNKRSSHKAAKKQRSTKFYASITKHASKSTKKNTTAKTTTESVTPANSAADGFSVKNRTLLIFCIGVGVIALLLVVYYVGYSNAQAVKNDKEEEKEEKEDKEA